MAFPEQPNQLPDPDAEARDAAAWAETLLKVERGGVLLVDHDEDDEDDLASVTSLKASILDYRRENGRTYHRFSDGNYFLPNDALEQERLDIANHLWALVWNGQLCMCPKKDGAKRVLDLGTGTGIWASDFADEHPDAMVLGVDLSPIQPEYVPPNCKFEIDDFERDWTWSEPFDLIFARNMCGAVRDWERVISQAYDNLEPGGYLEIHDNVYPIQCDDGTLTEDMALFKWSALLVEAAEIINRPLTMVPRLPAMMEAAGFEDVTIIREKMPASPWSNDPHLREIGIWTQASLLPGIEGIAMALFTRVLGWRAADVLTLCSQVRRDAKNLNIHAYWYGFAIYGRKPMPRKGD
ncbi:methyltransferase domain-containing protein [Colletotrichum plurivorum]|uniref:Methyltransferase domain-containing protein n=1 Tax=Colletotrichum plurivorum TaxID=2175906 RepID=A0A8H6KCY6_9PEZI|nr:methyltransferase domain-containing protein [Colletotrichum plurivorum]